MTVEKKRKAAICGQEGESASVNYLINKGFKVVARNVRYRTGEIDIVAIKKKELHFVEVKSKSTSGITDAYEAVTPSKIRKLIEAARIFLAKNSENKDLNELPCHFDVVSVDYTSKPPAIIFFEDAFEAETF